MDFENVLEPCKSLASYHRMRGSKNCQTMFANENKF